MLAIAKSSFNDLRWWRHSLERSIEDALFVYKSPDWAGFDARRCKISHLSPDKLAGRPSNDHG